MDTGAAAGFTSTVCVCEFPGERRQEPFGVHIDKKEVEAHGQNS